MTYSQVHDRARALAGRIVVETPANKPVALLLAHTPAGMIALLASLAAGRVTLLINPDQPADRIARILDNGRAGAILAPEGTTAPAGQIPVIARNPAAHADNSGFTPPDSLSADAAALVLYTSGSTGQPKGIVHSQNIILHRGINQSCSLGQTTDETLMTLAPINTLGGLLPAIGSLAVGFHLILRPPGSPREILHTIEHDRVTILKALPQMLNLLLAGTTAQQAVRGLRTVRPGGGGVFAADVAAWRHVLPAHCQLVHAYNQTEAGIATWTVPVDFIADRAMLPSGYMDPALEYALLDEHGQAVPMGEIGELVVRGRHIALGEWSNGTCVPGRIARDPSNAHLRIARTGDLVRMNPDGLLDIIGRGDRMVKILGHRVEPAEIEATLRRAPGVGEVSVEARMRDDIATLYAYASGVDGVQPNRQDVLSWLRGQLPAFMVPPRLLTLPHLPKLANGKIDRTTLHQLADRLVPAGGGPRNRVAAARPD